MIFHHVAVSVRNLDISKVFYEKLGFNEVHRWDADDSSLTIVHLKLDNVILELFAYSKNKDASPLDFEVGNNLPNLGVKHIGLNVLDVQSAFDAMKQAGYELGSSEINHGRTKINYFFVKDPDGIWVEIVQDDRGY